MGIRFSSSSRRRAGFSLIEVALALIVAAGGLLSVFGVFPISLRQSQMSRSDMIETGFASALLQTFAGNIRDIDDITVWNDPRAFWKAAAAGSGLSETITDANNGSKFVHAQHERAVAGQWTDHPFSPLTTFVAENYGNESGDEENVWYVAAEREEGVVPGAAALVQPAQFLVRLACIRRTARRVSNHRDTRFVLPVDSVKARPTGSAADAAAVDAILPNVYVLSVVSTDRGFPDTFIREPVFSQEFTFVHRP